MSDPLAALDPRAVAAWYGRLADAISTRKIDGADPLASQLLRHWLENRDATQPYHFDAPQHLRRSTYVIDVLAYHRAVYLTEEKAGLDAGDRWAGLIPRLKGKGYPKWNRAGTLTMEYQSLVQIPIYAQLTGTDGDRDLLYALHGFQLQSRVSLTATPRPGSSDLNVRLISFRARVKDRYDWDPTKRISVPNPDFGSAAVDAVEPGSETITVHHSNAKRIEKAGLAAPYDLVSSFWTVSDPKIAGPAVVDPAKKI